VSVAHLTQSLLLVLTISNLLGSRGLLLLLSPFIQCPTSIIPGIIVAMVVSRKQGRGWWREDRNNGG
jgi:hypothetical protein